MRLSHLTLLVCLTAPLYGQTLSGCAMFPANNVWNTPIDTLPVAANSSTLVSTIGTGKYVHPDFSSTGGVPFNIVSGSQARVPVIFSSPESDPGPYPIPPNAVVEGA